MYIRRTHTNNSATGERYFTYRLVKSERVGGTTRQSTLLNLGRHFAIEQDLWSMLCARVDEIMGCQWTLLPIECPLAVEREAQRIAALLLARWGVALAAPESVPETASPAADAPSVTKASGAPTAPVSDIQSVDVASLELHRPRSVGVEQLGLWAMQQLGFLELLTGLGINGTQCSTIIGSIIARMAAPGSELAAHRWLGKTSGLGELLDVDYETLPLISLYRASDVLWKRHAALEHSLFAKTCDLFNLDTTVTLYDLTNTYFEGEVPNNRKAHRARSKEKRSDCPLVTLGLVVDGSGFVRSSQTFAGNVAEAGTLATMLTDLNAPPGALVVMDAGIASEANIDWLKSQGYRYLVVSRERSRHFNPEQAIDIETASGDTVRGQKVLSEDGQEVRLYCYSQARSLKEEAMAKRFCEGFEAALDAIADGLSRPRNEKRITKLWERIGRLKEKSHGIGQHYHIELQADASGKIATALTWTKSAIEGSLVTHPGVYCLRSNETAWDAEKLWRTYIMLTDLEAVFRSLKSELGLRPVFHSKEERADGHLFITVLAYQFVQIIRRHLKESGIDLSWNSIRRIMAGQCRVTASFMRADGRALHVRKATRAEPEQLAIYRALNLGSAPGGVCKTIV
jgi:hypothetical protein